MPKGPAAAGGGFAPPAVSMERRSDGSVILRSPQPLREYPTNLGCLLFHWAATIPEQVFLAERDPHGSWRRLSYAEAARASSSVAQALIDRGLDQSRMVMVLSGNGIDHALMMLGAFLAGVPICPVSPAYSLLSADHGRLKHIYRLIEPALLYVASCEDFRPALEALGVAGAELVCSSGLPEGGAGTPFSELLATVHTPEVRRRAESVSPDHVAKILFTSGSTALPKGVVNTYRMLSSNQQMLRQCWRFLEHTPPVLLDWLPWNHTFGGNHNFNMVLRNGGTLFVDDGRPTVALIERTVANLREVSPNMYFSVPAGYAMLLPYLEKDDELARSFLRELRLVFYAAAALSQDVWDRLARLSIAHLGRRIPLTSGWGSTETAPLATTAHFPVDRADVIGLPVPGVEVKLAPVAAKLELRVRGPNVTPGYYRAPNLTREAFDGEGFYRTGDAGRLLDPKAPGKALVFDGRLAENFKLGTGTWVHVGVLRTAVLAACAPVLQDLVVCGEDRDQVGILAWPNVSACRDLIGGGAAADPVHLARAPEVLEAVRRGIGAHNRTHPGASARIARVHLMAEPASIDANEMTDKGYVNQRAVLERRVDLVHRLFADPPGPDVIVC
ncbi:MAG TPA: feruloyl-CoA synthase [Thermoanaerobaculia bacterium]